MYESKRRERRKGTEYLVEKLNALNLERSSGICPKYYVVNFTSGQMSVITLLMGLGFMVAVALIIKNVLSLGGVIGVLSLVAVVYLIACAILCMVFTAAFFNARLSSTENAIEIGYSNKEMHFLVDKIAEAQCAKR